MTDWAVLLGRLIASRSALHDVDDGLIYRYDLPALRASPDSISAAERRLGRLLDPQLCELLAHADGIRGVAGNDDLFGTSEIGAGNRWLTAIRLLRELHESGADVPAGSAVLPIGMSESEPSLLIQGAGDNPSPVTWIYSGAVGGQWPTLAEFVEAAIAMNLQLRDGLLPGGSLHETLVALRRARR